MTTDAERRPTDKQLADRIGALAIKKKQGIIDRTNVGTSSWAVWQIDFGQSIEPAKEDEAV